jgi:hypothetical protein
MGFHYWQNTLRLVPVDASSVLGKDILVALDKTIFSESKLSDTEIEEAKVLFSRVTEYSRS